MNNKNKFILVCGGAGYIGSHVVKQLINNYNIIIVDDLSTGYKNFIPDNTIFHNISIGDKNKLKTIFENYNIIAVIHLCANAYVGESVLNPKKYYHNNIINGLILLQLMIEYNVLRIVFSSSCAVYGIPSNIPINESTLVAPINPYGNTKAMFEKILSDYSFAYGLKYCSLRYFNAAGADFEGKLGERHDPETHLIPLVLEQAYKKKINTNNDIQDIQVFGNDYNTKDGTCIRDYIHVCDLAFAHELALNYLINKNKSEIFNLSNNIGYSVIDVINKCQNITGQKIDYVFSKKRSGDPGILLGSSKRAKKVLNWEPQYSDIETIIKTAWDWHKKYKSRNLL